MKFNRRFYNSEVNFDSISKKKLVLSIILGLVSAIVIYSFFYIIRETDRVMSLDFENRPLTIEEGSRKLFNLFFAAISLIVGNSIAISFLMSRPQNLISRRNFKRNRIINDQAFLVPSFIYWFTKIWFLFCAFAFDYLGPKFLDYFFLPSILLIVVLYLDSWKSLSLVIKKNRWKIKMFHFVTFIFLTFVLSQLNVIDYKSIDESAFSAHPTIEVPESSFYNDNYQRRYYDNIVFKIYFNSENEPCLFNAQNERIELYDIYKILKENEYQHPEELASRIAVRLRVDKAIPIKFIKRFELELLHYNQLKIIYETSNDDDLTSRFFNNQLRHYISPSLQDEFPVLEGMPPRVPIWDFHKEHKFQDTLSLNISDKILLNKTRIPLASLSEELKNYISSSTIFEYIYEDSTTYQDYINVFSAHKKALWELRDTENFGEIDSLIRRNQFSRDEKLNNERDRIKQKYPLHITERFE